MTKEKEGGKTKEALSQFAVEEFAMWVCAVMAMVCFIAGRVETFHMTEGEAFMYGWKYWVATIVFVFGSGLISKRHT